MATATARRTVTAVEFGSVTVTTGPTSDRTVRKARRNTYDDGSQAVIYVSTARRVAPAVAATFVAEVELTDAVTLANQNAQDEPATEVAQPSQLEPAELEEHLAQQDELLDSDGAKALEHEVAHAQADEAHERQMAEQADRAEQARISQQRAARPTPAAPVKHRMAWFDYIDGAKVPHSPERKRRLSDVISVQCTCGEASPTATRKEIDGWVAEHKRGLSAAA